MSKQYFNGQGKIYLGTRDANGNPLIMKYVGNAPEFKFSLDEKVSEHKESTSGLRLTDVRLTTELTAGASMTLEQLDADNLNLLLFGTTAAQATSAVTGEAIHGSTTPAVGDIYLLDSFNIAALVVKDSTGAPKTLTSGTNYSADLKSGQIELLDITTGGPYTGPLTADYTRATATQITKLFGTSAVEYWLRFVGKNTVVSGSPEVMVDLYRVRLSPTKDMALINDDVAQFALEGSVLADSTKTQAGDFGQFGRLVML
jgi:hypothetical protein